jgi:hypothetical protein
MLTLITILSMLQAPTAPTVTISPPGGRYEAPVQVTLSTNAVGSTIHYTLDGGSPGLSAPIYVKPFNVAESCWVRADAWKPDGTDTGGVEVEFTIVVAPPAPPGPKVIVVFPTADMDPGTQIIVLPRIPLPNTVTRVVRNGMELTDSLDYRILPDGRTVQFLGAIRIGDVLKVHATY